MMERTHKWLAAMKKAIQNGAVIVLATQGIVWLTGAQWLWFLLVFGMPFFFVAAINPESFEFGHYSMHTRMTLPRKMMQRIRGYARCPAGPTRDIRGVRVVREAEEVAYAEYKRLFRLK